MKPFSLSFSKFRQLNFDLYDRDFKFIYNQEIFLCNKLVADFLSPIIQKIHVTDPSLDEFVIPYDKNFQPSIFKEVILSGEFQEIEITEKNAKALQYFYSKLGNNEFSEYILFNKSNGKNSNDSSLNVNSVFQQLRIKSAIGISISQEVEFISSHLYELEKQIEKENSILTVSILQLIFSSPKICISNEEWLFNYIMKRAEEDKELLCLLEYVKFDNLCKKSVETFFKEVPFDEMNKSVYNSIMPLVMKSFNPPDSDNISISRRYHIDPQKKKEEEVKKQITRLINFDGRQPLKGIFHFLQSQLPQDKTLLTSGTIDITSSTNSGNNSDLKHLIDLNEHSLFISQNEPNQWVTFDFKNNRIVPRFYTFITNSSPFNGHHMKSWVIEVSDDNVNFNEVTTETNNITLNRPGNLVVFRTFHPKQGRYVRIRQTAPNWHNDNIMALAQVEFFGDLLENVK